MTRYRTDPVYRKNHKLAVKKYRKNKARKKHEEKLRTKAFKKYWMKLRVDGIVHDCCKVGFLAEALGLETQTLRAWHNRKNIPETIRYGNSRWYTKAHYDLILEAQEKFQGNRNKLFEYVTNKWQV